MRVPPTAIVHLRNSGENLLTASNNSFSADLNCGRFFPGHDNAEITGAPP
jgi:hypothetical protein